jgi:hypothetical protein
MNGVSDSALAEYSISKSLRQDDGTVILYINGAYETASSDAELRNFLNGPGIRVAISPNLVGKYNPPGAADNPYQVDPDDNTDSGNTSNEDFLSNIESIIARYATSSDDEDEEEEDDGEFEPTPEQIADLVPWLKDKGDLLDIYTNEYIETGSGDFAIAAVRQSEDYAKYYPGITRDDGSLRMTETEYETTREGYFRILLENGLNPTVFDAMGKVAELIAGDVDVPEFRTRIETTRTAFVDNPKADEIKSWYQANFGVDLSDNAVFAAALDPEVSRAILINQIDQAELGAEAALRNLDLNTNQAQRLLQAGITEEGATRLFARSADAISRLSALSARQGRKKVIDLGFTIESQVFQDPEEQRAEQAILAQQQSQSAVQTGAAKSQTGGVAGLTEI